MPTPRPHWWLSKAGASCRWKQPAPVVSLHRPLSPGPPPASVKTRAAGALEVEAVIDEARLQADLGVVGAEAGVPRSETDGSNCTV